MTRLNGVEGSKDDVRSVVSGRLQTGGRSGGGRTG